MNLFRNLFLVALSIGVLTGCNDDDDNSNTSRVNVALKTSTANTLKNIGAVDLLEITDFRINISEIEFDINDDMEDAVLAGDSVYSDLDLEGPFLIDLVKEDSVSAVIQLATANVPNAIYEEIEFEFDVYSKDKNEAIYGYTMIVNGTYNTTPFAIMSDEELEIELEYANGFKLDGVDSNLYIDLNLARLKTLVAAIDFSAATPNADGTIIISKESNVAILKKFEDAVEKSFDIDEDGDNDDE